MPAAYRALNFFGNENPATTPVSTRLSAVVADVESQDFFHKDGTGSLLLRRRKNQQPATTEWRCRACAMPIGQNKSAGLRSRAPCVSPRRARRPPVLELDLAISRTGMSIPVVTEICSTSRIIRPKTLHTVGDLIAGRRAIDGDAVVSWAGVIVAWGVVGGGQGAADERAGDKSSDYRSTPSPASSSPMNGFDCGRDCFGD